MGPADQLNLAAPAGRPPFRGLPAWMISLSLLLIILAAWEVYVRMFKVSPFILPPPSAVTMVWLELLAQSSFWYHTWITTVETALGFVFASIAGVALGIVLGKSARMEQVFNPFVVATQVIPKVAVVPLLIVWFGFGLTPKVLIAAILAFFPILTNTILGMKSVETGHREVMLSLNATRWQTLTQLEIPSSLPYILAGMEMGVVLSIIGAVVGEYLGGNVGLGNLAVKEMNSFNTKALFAVIVHLSILGFGFYALVVACRRYITPWHGPSSS